MSRVILKNISYKVPNGTKIFENLSFSFNSELIGLVGKNGSGKSTLAKLISNRIECDSGRIEIEGNIEYMPQLNQDLSDKSISEVFKISEKYEALIRLENGNGNEQDLIIIDNDWDLENRIDLVIATQTLKGVLDDEERRLLNQNIQKAHIIGSLPGADRGFEGQHLVVVLSVITINSMTLIYNL